VLVTSNPCAITRKGPAKYEAGSVMELVEPENAWGFVRRLKSDPGGPETAVIPPIVANGEALTLRRSFPTLEIVICVELFDVNHGRLNMWQSQVPVPMMAGAVTVICCLTTCTIDPPT